MRASNPSLLKAGLLILAFAFGAGGVRGVLIAATLVGVVLFWSRFGVAYWRARRGRAASRAWDAHERETRWGGTLYGSATPDTRSSYTLLAPVGDAPRNDEGDRLLAEFKARRAARAGDGEPPAHAA